MVDRGAMCEEILDALDERIVRVGGPDAVIRYCNPAWARAHGRDPADLVGEPLARITSQAEVEVLLGVAVPVADTVLDRVVAAPEAPDRLIEWSVRRLGADGDVIAVGRDVTDQRQAEQALAASEASFRELADRSADVIFRFSMEPEPHFAYLSPSFERITGHSIDGIKQDFRRFLEIVDEDNREMLIAAVAGQTMPDRYDLRFRRPDGSIVVGEMQVTLLRDGLLGVGRDVTEVRELQAELAALALRDPLTGLANRRLLDEVLTLALSRTDRTGSHLAVALLDLDGFKEINDTHGHEAGDAVLIETARRLSAAVREADVVARIGGDEFVIVHEAVGDDAPSLVDRLSERLSAPIEIAPGVTVRCEASIGVVDTDSSGRDPAALLAAADAAMYDVKRTRKARRDDA